MEFLVSDESPYFSHYTCEIVRATDVNCKSYKRKRSESSVTTKFTTFESMDRFNVNCLIILAQTLESDCSNDDSSYRIENKMY